MKFGEKANFKDVTKASYIEPFPAIDDDFVLVEKTVAYLKPRLANEIKLAPLTRKMGTNRNKLNKAFKTYYGGTVIDWLRQQRMQMASELLVNSSLNILQISEKVGYQDSNNFSTAFKQKFNLSPRNFRETSRRTVQISKKPSQKSKVNSQ
ncbi:helix-turn-helix transcriptional regulator [Thalassomonas viridans]|uniref:Helix-turn-helix transcriptional regulator n=1 Tax=Thalassomonas viridans TaxID=137584 RepID=A0AAE9Z8U7_9GAMM|nr:AraC family transcriptional regulator [Thalassomonas viridans]WDE08826.1 helix-turn-helix transcriptional regulator [Thalassomonas viridans]